MNPNDSHVPDDPLQRGGYSLDEVAAATPCSRRFLEKEIAAGRLLAHKVGRKTLILREDWKAWLRSRPKDAP